MVKNRDKGRRKTDKTDKIDKFTGYVDTSVKVIITTLLIFSINIGTSIQSDIAVIKLSYTHALEGIEKNEVRITNALKCTRDNETRIIKIEEKNKRKVAINKEEYEKIN